MEKFLIIMGKVTKAILFIIIGSFITYIFMSTHICLDKRESFEYANLLRCVEERPDYCPHCGKRFIYKYNNVLTDKATQDIIDKWTND